jgi:hypothetical protein
MLAHVMFNQYATSNSLKSSRSLLVWVLVVSLLLSSTEINADHIDLLANSKVSQCPKIKVDCPESIREGTTITCSATVKDGPANATPTYNWTVSTGTITSGQGTSEIFIDTVGLGAQTVTATLEIGGFDTHCLGTYSATTWILRVLVFDEHGNVKFKDEKARLDNYAIELQNEPSAQGYIIVYGSCDGEGRTHGTRIKKYLIDIRGISSERLQAIDAGCSTESSIQLWLVPSGASPPEVNSENLVPCQRCKKAKAPLRQRTKRTKKRPRNGP